jgi:hypothetical protein
VTPSSGIGSAKHISEAVKACDRIRFTSPDPLARCSLKFSIKFSHNLHEKFEGSMQGNKHTNTHTHTGREIYQKVQLVFISCKSRSKEACVGS